MSIFDFLRHWRCVGFFRIDKDLEELNRERHTARMEAASNPARLQAPPPSGT